MMDDDKDFGADAAHSGPRGNRTSGRNGAGGGARANGQQEKAGGFALDPMSLTEGILRRWHWMALVGGLFAVVVFFYTKHIWRNAYTASVQLVRFEALNSTVFYKPRQLTDQTFASYLKSPELLRRIASEARPPLSPSALSSRVMISPVRESDVVVIMVGATTMKEATNLANLYAVEAAEFMRDLQKKDAADANESLKSQLSRVEMEIVDISTNLPTASGKPSSRRASLEASLQKANEDLDKLLLTYTERWPAVQALKQQTNMLAKQIAQLQNAELAAPPDPSGIVRHASAQHPDALNSQLNAYSAERVDLAARQREAQIYMTNAPGYCKILAPATEKEVTVKKSGPKIMVMTIFAGVVGFFATLVVLLFLEITDSRLKGPRDVERVTDLPVLATLGDLDKMTPSEQRNWAFRTWTAIQGKLSSSPNHGLVCGITSAGTKEGRSTWVNMLAQAASECGFRVLTVATIPPNTPNPDDVPSLAGGNGKPHGLLASGGQNNAVSASVLSSPMQVTEQLTGDDPQPMVHIPLPGWVWNLERRKQWQSALSQWRSIDNIVILVELPPASQPEAVLLAQNLPNLIWLSDTGVVHAGPTREHLETLRNARCNLVGSVVNHAEKPAFKDRLSRWTACFVLCLALAGMARAAEPITPSESNHLDAAAQILRSKLQAEPAGVNTAEPVALAAAAQPLAVETNASFGITRPLKRSRWQQEFTLGPGDVLSFTLFGQPELARTEVPIGPDGRVTYLQAQDVLASGMTIDQLRTNIDRELSNFYRTPRTIITPVAYNSKKYYVLGNVVNPGVFSLDRPVTVIEAVARAHGLQTGILDYQNSVDIVDLQRSFVVRQGKQLPIDLEKLFQQGDLSQNVGVEPEDYLYFARGALKEVYVVGEVRIPGPVVYTENTTVVAAISTRGGFTDRAYKSHVLVVRGSLNAPKTFVVDTRATVDARAIDFRLQSKDIVYVSYRPFIKAEELLDLAATAFIQSAVSAWAGKNIGPLIKSAILPEL